VKPSSFSFLLAPLLFFSPSPAAQTTHYVDNLADCAGLVPCHATIGDAVSAAVPCDSIVVFPGLYREAVVIPQDKNNLKLRGRNKALMPVVAADPNAAEPHNNGFTLMAFGVQVRDFVIEAPNGHGVQANGPGGHFNVIQGNTIHARRGITLGPCNASVVKDNWVLDGGINLGIHMITRCLIEGNVAEGIGGGGFPTMENVIRRNRVRGGIGLGGESVYDNVVEWNQVEGGIVLLGDGMDGNIIRRNVVRGGGIRLQFSGHASCCEPIGINTIEANMVSGSPADGIVINAAGGATLVRKNTSVDNAGCDINDTARSDRPQNNWTDNRFETSCGAARN